MTASVHPFDQLKSRTRHNRINFVRDLKSEVSRLDDGTILVITRLLDEFHDMSIAMAVDDNLVIQDIACKFERMPYPVCTSAERAYDGVKGLMVFKRGIVREIRSRVERTEGCTHFTELIEASLRALFAGVHDLRSNEELRKLTTNEEKRQLNIQRPYLSNTCRSFRAADADKATVDVAIDKIRAAGYDEGQLESRTPGS